MSEPTLTPRSAQLVFGLAHRIAPESERVWLEEMGHEYSFLGRGARLRWLFGMVGLALRLRAATFTRWKLPRRLWLAPLAGALFVVALFVVSPVTLRPSAPGNSSGSDPRPSQTYRAENADTAGNAAGPSFTESEQDEAARAASAPTANLQSRAAAPASLATPLREADTLQPATAEPESVETTKTHTGVADTETADTETAGTGAAAETVATPKALSDTASADAGRAEAAPTEAVVTSVASETVTLRLTGTVWLELRRGAADGPVLQKGTFQAGQSFSVTVPFYLSTSDASRTSVQAGAESLGSLGRLGESQTRLFVKP